MRCDLIKTVFWSLLLLVVFSAHGCKGKESEQINEIRLGVLCELTGEAAAWGIDLKEGIDLAVEEINERGGINGSKIIVLSEDSQGKPRTAMNAVMKLVSQDRIDILAGVAVSTVANAILPTLKRKQIFFVSGGASSPSLSGASPYFFRTWPSDLEEALVAARYLREQRQLQSAVVVYANDDYGVGLQQPFETEFAALGGVVTGSFSFEKGGSDFKPQIVKVTASGADVLFLVGTPRDMARFLKQLRGGGVLIPVFSVSGFKELEVLEIAGSAAEGVEFVDSSFDPSSNRPATKTFLRSFQAAYGKGPGVLAASGYDSVMVLGEAIKNAGSTDADKLRDAVLGLDGYDGAVGDITFSEDGNVHRPVRISVVRNGEFASEKNAY